MYLYLVRPGGRPVVTWQGGRKWKLDNGPLSLVYSTTRRVRVVLPALGSGPISDHREISPRLTSELRFTCTTPYYPLVPGVELPWGRETEKGTIPIEGDGPVSGGIEARAAPCGVVSMPICR